MMSLMDMIISLEQMGLTDVMLPFLIIFAILFAVTRNIKLLGENSKIQTFLSLAFALMVVIPHITGSYPPGKDVVEIMNGAIPNVSGVIIGVIMFLILIGVFGIRPNIARAGFVGIVTLFAGVIVFIIFGSSAGWFDLGLPPWLSFLNNPDLLTLIVTLLVFWIIIALVTAKEDGKDAQGNDEVRGFMKFLNAIGSGFTEDKK